MPCMNMVYRSLSNPKPGHTTGRAGRAAHGGVAGRSGARQFGTPTDPFAQKTTDHPAPQGIEDNCPERLFGSTNKGNLM